MAGKKDVPVVAASMPGDRAIRRANADARRALALAAAEYTMEALNVMVKLMRTARQEGVSGRSDPET